MKEAAARTVASTWSSAGTRRPDDVEHRVTMRLVSDAATARPVKVLVYSDDANVRQQVILALGRRPHPDLPEVEYVEVATEPVVIQNMDSGTIDLAILDGEAVPAGGMGIAKQLKDEIYDCPPILVLTGRPQDAWLATWSRAEAAVPHPIDPIQLAETVVGLLRPRARHLLTALGSAAYAPAPRTTAGGPMPTPGPTCSPRSWPHRPERRAGALGDGRDPRRRGHARADRRLRGRAARQGRDDRGGRGLAEAMYAAAQPDLGRRVACSTSSAPAATGRCRSTSPRWPRSSPRAPARGWSSTATGRPRRSPAAPTCSRRSASGSTSRPARVAEVARGGRDHLLLLGRLPPGHAARRASRGASSASRRRSTSSAR